MNLQTTTAKTKFKSFINNPRTKKAMSFAKDNWREIAAFGALALIVDDLDTAADIAEASLTLDVITASTEGVI